MIGKDKVQFVGHEIDLSEINMSQIRIEGETAFTTPRTLKEQYFLGLINYFKDYILDHSLISRPLYQIVADVTKSGNKTLVWDEHADTAFEALNTSFHHCQKLYFIDYSLKTILYADADYVHGAYLCQERQLDGNTVEEPIRFLVSTFHGPQTRRSTIEKETYAICWALLRLDDLIGKSY